MEAAPHPRVRVAGPWPLAVSLAELSHSGRICPLVPGMGFMDLTTAHRAVDLLLTQFCWNFRNFESSVIHLCLKHDPSSVARLCLVFFFLPRRHSSESPTPPDIIVGDSSHLSFLLWHLPPDSGTTRGRAGEVCLDNYKGSPKDPSLVSYFFSSLFDLCFFFFFFFLKSF